jgi:hypothetical protein
MMWHDGIMPRQMSQTTAAIKAAAAHQAENFN